MEQFRIFQWICSQEPFDWLDHLYHSACQGRGEYDSAFSAERVQTFAWWQDRPLNYSLERVPRTQDLEPVYVETSAFFVFREDVWREKHRRIGERAYMAVTDRIESMDIDNPDDFLLAEAIVAAGLNK